MLQSALLAGLWDLPGGVGERGVLQATPALGQCQERLAF